MLIRLSHLAVIAIRQLFSCCSAALPRSRQRVCDAGGSAGPRLSGTRRASPGKGRRSRSIRTDVEDKASIFSVNYRNNDYLPVFFVITNDGDQPVSLVGMKAQLNTKDRSKLLPATKDELLRRLSHPDAE